MDSKSSDTKDTITPKSENPKKFAWRIFLQAGERGKHFFN